MGWRNRGWLCAVVFVGAALNAMGQEGRREIRWNNPEGTKTPRIEHGSFESEAIGVEVGYNVALAEGYAEGEERYPVVYFLHGAGGDENSDAAGFAGLMARLAKAKEIPPVICVFPNGGMSGYRDNPERKVMVESMIVKELIPRIDTLYRTKATREGRAIAGFSMGGGGAVRLALRHPELFSAAGSWAGSIGGRNEGSTPPELESEALKGIDGKVRLFLIVGDQDRLFERHGPTIEALKGAGYPYREIVLEGVGHDLGALYEKTGEELARFLTAGF